MQGLQTNNAPHPSVIIPHFVFASIALIGVAMLLLLSESALIQVYFSGKLIAITHLTILGWASMIIFGALYQLIPVVFETSLYSERLAKITFYSLGVSVVFLSYAFWINSFTVLLPYAALATFISLLLFVINVFLSYKKSPVNKIESKFILMSIVWLSVTEFIGTMIAFNFKFNFLSEIHLHYLKIHATIGFVGWFLFLIIGVGSTLLPMFFISHELNKNWLRKSFVFLNLAMLVLLVNGFSVNETSLEIVTFSFSILGIAYFLRYIYQSYKKRLRKKLDVGMRYSALAMALLVLPIIILTIVFNVFPLDDEFVNRAVILYGFSVLFGFITTLILGQTYKTLPFIVWLHKYQKLVGKTKTPLPRELYSEKIASIQFYTYFLCLIVMGIGIITQNLILLKIASYLLLLVGILYTINVMKIIVHSSKNTP
ncbi:MAG: hypothetical protein COB60_07225 [Flavobacteriaceae bacterium]|nr:MAG: hypothetical protein COB60_07225 [Flavobacteriaceae bacterium]